MTSRSSYITNKQRPRGDNNELVQVRSNVFYGIETQQINEQENTEKREITTVPNIIFYDNYTKVMIDFSDYENNQDNNDIKALFKLLESYQSFTINGAKWKNSQISQNTFDLSGTFVFTSIKENIIFANITSITSYTSNITRYDKEFFIVYPNFEISNLKNSSEKITKSYIFNYLGKNSKNSFSYLGLIAGDYIEIQNYKNKFEILNIQIDTEGKETITVNGILNNENNVGIPILITGFQKNNNKIIPNFNSTTTGKCELFQNNVMIQCIDNQTELQSKLRENKNSGITSVFYPNEFCNFIIPDIDAETPKPFIDQLKSQIESLRIRNTQISVNSNNIPLSTRSLIR